MSRPIIRTNKNGDSSVVGDYDDLKAKFTFFYSRTKDEFAKRITVRLPQKFPSDVTKIQLRDKDFGMLWEIENREEFDKAVAKADSEGFITLPMSTMKVIQSGM